MELIPDEVIVFFGGCIKTSKKVDPNQMYVSPYLERIEYINGFLGVDVHVIQRSGARILVASNPPTHGGYNKAFIVRRHIRIDYSSYNTFVQSLSRVDDDADRADSMMAVFKDEIRTRFKDKKYGDSHTFEMDIDVGVTYQDYVRSGGCFYLHEVDIVICDPNNKTKVLHPYSTQSLKRERLVDNNALRSKEDFFFRIELIDNKGTIDARYIKVGEKVFCVKPKFSPTRQDGVYVTRSMSTDGKYYVDQLEEVYLSHEDAEKEHLLFRSFESALFYAENKEVGKKIELEDLSHETAKLKAETAHETAKSAKDKAFWDRHGEFLKLVGIVCSAILAIAAGMKAIFQMGVASVKK